jgi:putative ABC transport system permease protein
MIKFLLKGIIHDRSRSLLPVIVVAIGVMLTVILYCWMNGIMGESISLNANFNTGHLKVMTRAYAKDADQMPNELAILEVNKLMQQLKTSNPEIDWVKRIRFGALIDFPDSSGETRAQGPVIGWAIDLFSKDSKEKERFNIEKSIVSGKMPAKPSEALITNAFAEKFKINPGDTFTLFGTTMDGSMAFKNFTVAGTVSFGSAAIDRGAIITDIADAQEALSMKDGASEVLGYFSDGQYNNEKAALISKSFNTKYENSKDEFAPVMLTLRDQEGMAELLDYMKVIGGIMISIFVFAMSVVLWNAGLLGSLRRYNEFGVRLALGEGKTHIFKTIIYEGILIGSIGTVVGTAIGLAISYFLQNVGLNIGSFMRNSTLMMPSVARAIVTPTAFYIGFIPGLVSMVLGNALAGLGIYKRKTAQLFKELEV